MNNKLLLSALYGADSILMCTHISPDGDAIGSMLACGRLLDKMGKKVYMVCADPVPAKLRFLPGADKVLLPDALEEMSVDLALALDCADESRMGKCFDAYSRCKNHVQIDHHDTNPQYAAINEVDGHASSTGCMIWRLMKAMNVEPDKEMAACIYTAISTDTGNFSFSNTDEETFACAAAMVKTGFDLNDISRKVHLLREEKHVRLLGSALKSLRLFADGNCACMTLTKEAFEAIGAGNEHTDGIVNYALNIPGVKMAYLMDLHEEKHKISFRAIAPYRVSHIAAMLGGGGHVLAAGCRTEMAEEEAAELIEREMRKQIEELK
ncbi:MAG: bifunctional oligoribonuclease/PAP phosphatase NrnA [Clostridia bacterium]|nr:bifunctional oligoribonuclease/PAP phosphatase NrnA [Clostridia bacterium]